MIFEIADVLTADEVRQCRERLLTAQWQDGRATACQIQRTTGRG
jgi:predicted 2-oxoglutarate/Fe(II)-dependent dioxygenase YbiX